MPRIHTVQKARASKRTRTCRVCGHEIQPGEMYRYFEPRYGPPVMYCAEHYPARSHMTSSKLGPLYDAQDDFAPSECENLEDLQSALSTIADTAREIASEYEESISNMPEGLQEGPTAEEMREKIDALESYADELEGFDPDTEEFEEDEVRREVEEHIASEMVSEMDFEAIREQVRGDADVPDIDSDDEAEDPLEGMDEKEIVASYGDETDYASRVDEEIERRREEWNEDHSEDLAGMADEASELVSNFEY